MFDKLNFNQMVYLIPTLLAEEATATIPLYVISCLKECKIIFAENIRTARRFMKKMDSSIVIDDFEWHEIDKDESKTISGFLTAVHSGKSIAIISEAGCPGVADPGQKLVSIAQEMKIQVKPLVGPSSILLALMASGLNGQHFTFHGYLPIESTNRIKKIKQLEEESYKNHSTHIFIETPYRNNALIADILKTCKAQTLLCIGAEITSTEEWIKTMAVSEWKQQTVNLHKKTAIFLLGTRN